MYTSSFQIYFTSLFFKKYVDLDFQTLITKLLQVVGVHIAHEYLREFLEHREHKEHIKILFSEDIELKKQLLEKSYYV